MYFSESLNMGNAITYNFHSLFAAESDILDWVIMLYYDDKSILWAIYAPSWNLMNANLTISNRRNVSNYPESSITKFRNSLWQLLKKEIPQKMVKCFWGIRCLLCNQLRGWLIRHQQIHFDPYSLLQIKINCVLVDALQFC